MSTRTIWGLCVTLTALFLAVPAEAQRGTTERVSVSSAGQQGNDHSRLPSISADGRFVAFDSYASNLVPGDTNGTRDVFVYDRQTGHTTRVSVSSAGQQGNGASNEPAISADGRFVAFDSEASNLVSDDNNGTTDVFVHDRQTGQTTRASVSSVGEQGNSWSRNPSISTDGRCVAFHSLASNLVSGDVNGATDVFAHDRQTGQTTRVSVSSTGEQGFFSSFYPSISADGRFVAFASIASNLVSGDTNGTEDVFVHDRQTGQTTRVSVSSAGQQGNSLSSEPSISADGQFVAFYSWASNLVLGDTNGAHDVFVHDRQTGQTTRVSVSSAGQQGNGGSWEPSISANGRFVAFLSTSSNLVQGDTNKTYDVFVHDRQTGQTTRVSISSAGQQGNFESYSPSISADGRFVAFYSHASNLVPGDTNGTSDIFVHQYGPGSGGNQGGGNTGGDPPLRDRRLPRDPNRPAPIVLVNGLNVTDGFRAFLGGTTGHLQWENFKSNFVFEYGSRGYSVYDPNTNANGNLFIVENLNTFFGVSFNALLLDIYLQGISNAPAMQSGDGFDIVGYSMGGLIARRWEQMYDQPVGGAGHSYSATQKRVFNIVTVATPHLGSPLADATWRFGLPSVMDFTTWATYSFNLRNPGLPGARYSRIAADLNLWWPLRGQDGVVGVSSATASGWLGSGYLGRTFSLANYAHSNATWLGLVGVLNDMPSVNAVYQSIYGGSTDSSDGFLEETMHSALAEVANLLPNTLIERDIPISSAAGRAGFMAQWSEGSAQVTLIEPGGRIIDPETAAKDPNIEHFAVGGTIEGYSIANPIPGVWTLRVMGGNDVPAKGTECNLNVIDDAACESDGASPPLVRLGSQGRFLVEVRTPGARLLGGSVSATLVTPGGATHALTFYDDGKHGDGDPGDGLFGSDLIVGKEPGAYVVDGHISGSLPGFGGSQRTFTMSFSASPETGRITGLKAFRPVDDPDDEDGYFDILNSDVSLQITTLGAFTLAGELHDAEGKVIDIVSKSFEATATGAQVVALHFRGAVIGEHDKDGPFVLRNVSLTHDTEPTMLTDFVNELATTDPYSRLLFETIHPRTVAPTGRLQFGFNMISLPLDPLPGRYTLRDILGPNFVLQVDPMPPPVGQEPPGGIRRGEVYRVFMWGPLPETAAYLGTEDDYEFEMLIPGAGMKRIGCPYNRPLPLSRTIVKNNITNEYRTAEQDAASKNPWVDWNWRYFEGGVWKYVRIKGGDDDHLRPWYGYEVTFNIGGVTLILRD